MLTKFFVWTKTDEGATALEYGLLVGLIALAIVVAAGLLGEGIEGLFTDATTELNAAGTVAP